MSSPKSSPSLIALELSNVQLGDLRLNKRAATLLEQMSREPDKSLSTNCDGWGDTHAAYRFFNNDSVTFKKLLEAHRQRALTRIPDQGRILIAQDTTELDYTANTTLKGAGPIAQNQTSKRTGFFMHAQYLIDQNHTPLGVWDLEFESRDPAQVGLSQQRKKLPIEEKSSYRWLKAYLDACDLQAQHPDQQVISLSDREADIYEIFAERHQRIQQGKPAAHYTIRAKENRVLLPDEQTNPQGGKLIDQLAKQKVLGTHSFEVPTRSKTLRVQNRSSRYTRTARKVTQEIRVLEIKPRPPHRNDRKLPQITHWAILAKELNPPAGEPPIEWTILTSIPIRTLDDATQTLTDYLGRWQIEVFFRTLKTACRIEKLRLKTAEALQKTIALYSIVAWRINHLSARVKEEGDESCENYFSRDEWQSTIAIVTPEADLTKPPSLKEFLRILARLGGHLDRKFDPSPGAQALWQGMQKMIHYAKAWRAYREAKVDI